MVLNGKGADAAMEIITSFGTGTISEAIMPVPGTRAYRSAWEKTIEAAEEANTPGVFTAFIGYEWTSNTLGMNLHRNVVYRNGGDLAKQLEPYTTQKPLGSDNPADLWKWMSQYEEKTGGDALAIPHNGNLSNGLMFHRQPEWGRLGMLDNQLGNQMPLLQNSGQGGIYGQQNQISALRRRLHDCTSWSSLRGDLSHQRSGFPRRN